MSDDDPTYCDYWYISIQREVTQFKEEYCRAKLEDMSVSVRAELCPQQVDHVANLSTNCERLACVSPAPQFTGYMCTASLTSFFIACLIILVVYMIALCSSINTTTFCLFYVCSVLTPTAWIDLSKRAPPNDVQNIQPEYLYSLLELLSSYIPPLSSSHRSL